MTASDSRPVTGRETIGVDLGGTKMLVGVVDAGGAVMHRRVRETRLFFQHACEANFRESVERITHRKVRAFTSGTDTIQDVSSEVFYLEPRQV